MLRSARISLTSLAAVTVIVGAMSGCTSSGLSEAGTTPPVGAGEGPSSTTTTATVATTTTKTATSRDLAPVETVRPPTTTSESQWEPVELAVLGPGFWWIADHGGPDQVVKADLATGEVIRIVWTEPMDGGHASGATLACREIDGTVQPVELFWSLDGPMRETYNERIELNGDVIGQRTMNVDGTSLPHEVNEVCGQPRFPVVWVTVLQLSALLSEAGFTDIAGDHAVDPVWEANASWDGREYWPLNLFQGDFRPPARPETELLECRMGGLEITTDLPTDARSRLVDLAGCSAT